MMRGFASDSTFSPRSRGVSAAHAPRRAHLSRQVYQSHQVASCERQLVMCVHAIQSTHHCTAHRRPRLRPSVDPFGHLPLDLADLIPRMAAGACVNRAAASASCVLCHMRGDLSFSTLGHEVGRIVVFISPQGAASGALRRRTAFSHFRTQVDPGLGRWLTGSPALKTTTFTTPTKRKAVASRKAALRTSRSAANST